MPEPRKHGRTHESDISFLAYSSTWDHRVSLPLTPCVDTGRSTATHRSIELFRPLWRLVHTSNSTLHLFEFILFIPPTPCFCFANPYPFSARSRPRWTLARLTQLLVYIAPGNRLVSWVLGCPGDMCLGDHPSFVNRIFLACMSPGTGVVVPSCILRAMHRRTMCISPVRHLGWQGWPGSTLSRSFSQELPPQGAPHPGKFCH